MELLKLQIPLPMEALQLFCQRWEIQVLEVFGSILRDDFNFEESDIDFLATFKPSSKWSLLDRVRMQFELEDLLHRKVDLLDRREIEQSYNWIRRENILTSARVIYEQR